MPYTLYNHTGSGGFAVEAALALIGHECDVIEIDTKAGEQFSDAYRAINPWCQVPALRLPDGTLITESAAMVIHLVDAYPDAGLGPRSGSPEHAVFLRWMLFMTINIYESDLRAYYAKRYTDDPAGIPGVERAGLDHMRRGLETMEGVLSPGPYILGTSFSIADVYLAMLRVWYRADADLPRIDALRDGIATHPKLAPIWQRHFGDR